MPTRVSLAFVDVFPCAAERHKPQRSVGRLCKNPVTLHVQPQALSLKLETGNPQPEALIKA